MLPREHYAKQSFTGLNQLTDASALTAAQRRLIKKHGALIIALLAGEVLDPSPADQRLIKVITQKTAPTTPVEQAWLKFDALLVEQNTAKTLRQTA